MLRTLTAGESRALSIDYSMLKKEKKKVSHTAKLIIIYNHFTGAYHWQMGIYKVKLCPTAFIILIPLQTLAFNLTSMVLWREKKKKSVIRIILYCSIFYWFSLNSNVGDSAQHFGPDWNIFTTIGSITSFCFRHSWSPESLHFCFQHVPVPGKKNRQRL